jgi:proteasome lid subunit RPN8/RPN11
MTINCRTINPEPETMAQINQTAYQSLRRHSEASYPEECCGILLGDSKGSITLAIAAQNSSPSPNTRYQIDPSEVIRAQKSAHLSGLVIVGFYHSHPDHPPRPSPSDLHEAHWLGSLYLITTVELGKAQHTRAHRLTGTCEEDKQFEPVKLVSAWGDAIY